jgi:hypothetical protein
MIVERKKDEKKTNKCLKGRERERERSVAGC